MAELSIIGISGNVTTPSRTAVLVGHVLEALAARTGAAIRLVELVDAAPILFQALTPDRLEGEARDLVRSVERADAIVVGTPVYKAAYTGALKHLMDLVQHNALVGTPTILTATGGTPSSVVCARPQAAPADLLRVSSISSRSAR